MADIELVIKIDEEIYQHTQEYEVGGFNIENDTKLFIAIKNGKLLPKGHGRLIDARDYENSIRKYYFDNRAVTRCTEIALANAYTIIEADKDSEE